MWGKAELVCGTSLMVVARRKEGTITEEAHSTVTCILQTREHSSILPSTRQLSSPLPPIRTLEVTLLEPVPTCAVIFRKLCTALTVVLIPPHADVQWAHIIVHNNHYKIGAFVRSGNLLRIDIANLAYAPNIFWTILRLFLPKLIINFVITPMRSSYVGSTDDTP